MLNTLFILGGVGLLLCVFMAGVAVGSARRLLRDVDDLKSRVRDLESVAAMKPNSRAAIEKRDAYEEALFAVSNALADQVTATVRLETLQAVLSKKAAEVAKKIIN